MLEAREGNAVAIATPDAVQSDDLHHLESEVLT